MFQRLVIDEYRGHDILVLENIKFTYCLDVIHFLLYRYLLYFRLLLKLPFFFLISHCLFLILSVYVL